MGFENNVVEKRYTFEKWKYVECNSAIKSKFCNGETFYKILIRKEIRKILNQTKQTHENFV